MTSPKKPLRLLTIGHSYVLAINRSILRHIARDKDFGVTVAAPDYFHGDLCRLHGESEPLDSPLKLIPLRTRGSRFVHLFSYDEGALRRLLTDNAFDVVHVWEEPYIYAGYQIARAVKRYSSAKLIFRTAQSLHKRYLPPFDLFERWSMARADGWIAGGQLVYETMVARGYDPARGRVLSLAVDTSLFQPLSLAQKAAARVELNVPDGVPVVGFLGRLTMAKGVRVLMEAVSKLPAGLPWYLVFLGSGSEKAHILHWARDHGWQDRVLVRLARHDEVPWLLGAFDLLAAPSQTTPNWKEQFGRMLIEAFACGVPVVGSDSGEIPAVVGDAGIIVHESDTARWTAEIADLLTNAERRKTLSQMGLVRAQRFSASELAGQYAAFYRQVLASPNPPAG